MNRDGNVYRNRRERFVVLVLSSKQMSRSSWRYEALVLDRAATTMPDGMVIEFDAGHFSPWRENWEEIAGWPRGGNVDEGNG